MDTETMFHPLEKKGLLNPAWKNLPNWETLGIHHELEGDDLGAGMLRLNLRAARCGP